MVAPNFQPIPPPFCQVKPVAYVPDAETNCSTGVQSMIRFVIDVVLFSCMFAFVTGIVIVGAHLL
jgi:hypothetical protein